MYALVTYRLDGSVGRTVLRASTVDAALLMFNCVGPAGAEFLGAELNFELPACLAGSSPAPAL